MSLINQMLKDLAERHPKDALSTSLLATHSYSSAEPRANHSWLLYVGAPLTLLALVLIGVQQASPLQFLSTPTAMEPRPTNQNSLPRADDRPAIMTPKPERLVAPAPSVAATASAPVVRLSTKTVTKSSGSKVTRPAVIASPKAVVKPARISTDKNAMQLHQQALTYYRTGEFQQAEALWKQVTNLPNPPIDALMQYGLYLVRSGQTNRAADLLSPYSQSNRSTTALLNLYSNLLIEQGDMLSAISQLQRQRSLGKFDIESKSMLAALLQKNADHKNAAVLYQEIIADQPQASLAWLGLGISREALGELSASYFAYQQALEQPDIAPHLREFILSRTQALQPNGSTHANP